MITKTLLPLTLALLMAASFALADPNTPSAATGKLDTEYNQISYALGSFIGNNLNDTLKARNTDVDLNIFIIGITDSLLNNKAALDPNQVQAAMQALEAQTRKKMEADQAKQQAAGKVFLAENAKKEGVKTTPSGLQYKVLREGTGEKPTATNTVKVHYRGTLVDGTEFDSSYKRGEPIQFPLNGVIPGWSEGVQLMQVGAKYQFTIPSNLGYGERGTRNIPPHSTLIFDVELIEIVATPKDDAIKITP